jgi:hypothetical protein
VRRFQHIVLLYSAGISDKYRLGEITLILCQEKPAFVLTETRRRRNGSTWNRHPLMLILATCVSATRMRLAWTITGTTRTVRTWGLYFAFLRQRAQTPCFEVDSRRPKRKARPRRMHIPLYLSPLRRHVKLLHSLSATVKMTIRQRKKRPTRRHAHVCGPLM